jgi:hypothetical protein
MPASFPTTVRQFTAKVDLQDTILADHINALQDEVRAIEITLNGTTDATNGLLTSNYSGTFSSTSTWNSLDDRISNIEAGLVNGLAISPYVKKAGDNMSVSNAVALTLKNTSATTTSNLFEAYNSANILGFALNGSGLPKVGTANVLYVGSSEYTTLDNKAQTALETAESAPFNSFLLAGM